MYQRECWLFLGYAAWIIVPMATFYFAIALPRNPFTIALIILTILLQLFIWLWISICLMKATTLLTHNTPIDYHALSTASLRRIQPVLSVMFLQSLIFLGGFLLLILPSILFWVWYAMAQTSAAIDDKPVVESLSYSRQLVAGRFLTVLWRLVAGPLVIALLYAFVSGGLLLTLSTLLDADMSVVLGENPPLWASLTQSIADVLFIPLFIIYSVLLYQDLKSHPVEKATLVT
jgi:hypothetical protein